MKHRLGDAVEQQAYAHAGAEQHGVPGGGGEFRFGTFAAEAMCANPESLLTKTPHRSIMAAVCRIVAP
mgnify:CR=1 FL=1